MKNIYALASLILIFMGDVRITDYQGLFGLNEVNYFYTYLLNAGYLHHIYIKETEGKMFRALKMLGFDIITDCVSGETTGGAIT